MSEIDFRFEAMGCEIGLVIGEPMGDRPPATVAAESTRRYIVDFDAALSRFRPDSELSAFNGGDRERVPASELLRKAVSAGVWAAHRTGGLVDPTLMEAIEAAGYHRSLAGTEPASLRDALEAAPPRRAARPDPACRWRQIEVDNESGTISRPPGLRFDTGGSGKGLAADLVAEQLEGYSYFVVDCGGDIRVGGPAAEQHPFAIEVEHPLSHNRPFVLRVGSGAVATSGLDTRIWQLPEGGFKHHLIDPSTGESAWTGLISVTALGASALEAETLSKAALLCGPEGAREFLAERGGLIVHDNGRVEPVGPLATPRFRIPTSSSEALLGDRVAA